MIRVGPGLFARSSRARGRIETLQKTVDETAASTARMDAAEDLHRVVHTVSAQRQPVPSHGSSPVGFFLH